MLGLPVMDDIRMNIKMHLCLKEKNYIQVHFSKQKRKNNTETEEQGTKNTELEENPMHAMFIWLTSTLRQDA